MGMYEIRRRIQIAMAAAALVAAPALAGAPLNIRLRQRVSLEPATLALDVVVERDANEPRDPDLCRLR
jgi:hypothetical protein